MLVLLTTVFVRTPLEFSVFPTVLLAATLGRLVLNTATTRMILSKANEDGLAAAGGIVQGFGSFVAGDQIEVGLIIFSIIVIVQFLVVTKGATRISEVAARFALDGMPGRQMSIDADLNAGLIDQLEAHRRREELSRSADFYGAMDGASKFVRGDAIAGLIITLINIAGGLFIGIVHGGMSFGQAAEVYTKLTIGDGLVSQIPAFLISLAAGLLITRSSEQVNLPLEFLRQLLQRPEPLVVAALFVGILIFTQLPAVPLLLVGGSFVAIALFVSQSPEIWEEATPDALDAATVQPERRVEDLLAIDPVELEIGAGLLRLADAERGGDLLERITGLRQKVALELGIVLPRVRIRDNLRLEEYGYRFKIFDNVADNGRAYPLRLLATESESVSGSVDGLPGHHPVNDRAAWWIDPGLATAAEKKGYELLGAVDVIVSHLQRTVERHADELLTRDATKNLLDQLQQTSPAVVDELVPHKLSVGAVQQVLHGLLRESISIRNLPVILEALCDATHTTQQPAELIEQVRRRLSKTISAKYRDRQGLLQVITLSSTWEQRLAHAIGSGESRDGVHSGTAELDPVEIELLCEDTKQALDAAQRQSLPITALPIVALVSARVRGTVKRLTATALPQLVVLSYNEITPETQVRSLGVVGEAA